MTAVDIIRIAREAGLHLATDVNWMPIIGLEYAEKFAALVIANHPPKSFMTWQEGYEAGKQAEREACAKVCDGLADTHAKMNQWSSHKTADTLAQAIRARGNT
jgi:hypothetical protein